MDKRIGLVGLDSAQGLAFARALNDAAGAGRLTGGAVVAFPGGAPDHPEGHAGAEGSARELLEGLGVQIVNSPEAAAEACDLLIIVSSDGRLRLDQLRRTLPYQRPTFVGAPLAPSAAEAMEVFRRAWEAGVPLMSCSALRYEQGLSTAMEETKLGRVMGCDAYAPAEGIHVAEILYRVMGTGCLEVRATRSAEGDVVVGAWADGRIATLRTLRNAHQKYGVTLHREKGVQHVKLGSGKRPDPALLLEAIVRSLPQGVSDIPDSETLEVLRFGEAAKRSGSEGRAVRV